MALLSIIGFGEAASTFAASAGWRARAHAFDIKIDFPATRASKLADFAAAGVTGCADVAATIANSPTVLCLVTADQAVEAARAAMPHLRPETRWIDMNSVAPATKRQVAALIEPTGTHYVDAAIMAPVRPLGCAVPLLVAGNEPRAAVEVMRDLGFTNVTHVEGGVGAAAAVKMVRSVLIKGMEALIAECMVAGSRAGVLDDVIASLDGDLRSRIDLALGRMLVHGKRRAAEMAEAVATLEDLAVEPWLTRGTVRWQEAIGSFGDLARSTGERTDSHAIAAAMSPGHDRSRAAA